MLLADSRVVLALTSKRWPTSVATVVFPALCLRWGNKTLSRTTPIILGSKNWKAAKQPKSRKIGEKGTIGKWLRKWAMWNMQKMGEPKTWENCKTTKVPNSQWNFISNQGNGEGK